MPIENEIKFVLNLQQRQILTADLIKKPNVQVSMLDQAYLDADSRIRSTKSLSGIDYVYCYKKLVSDQVVEVEAGISEDDFRKLYSTRSYSLTKRRFSWNENEFKWCVDEFKNKDDIYFLMAEVEMPPEYNTIPAPSELISSYLVYIVPKHDRRFNSNKLYNVEYAKKLYRSVLTSRRDERR